MLASANPYEMLYGRLELDGKPAFIIYAALSQGRADRVKLAVIG
jgi:hypothetical protein